MVYRHQTPRRSTDIRIECSPDVCLCVFVARVTGSVNYLRAIIENGKIFQEIPEVPEERFDELLCTAME